MASLAPSRALVFGLALAAIACGPRIATTRTAYTPRPRVVAFRAVLADGRGAEVACEGDGSVGCVLDVASPARGRHRLHLERDGATLEGDLGLRGSERSVAVYWLAPEPAVVLRVQRAPAALTLSLATLDPHREWARQLPIVVLTNGTPATLRGAGFAGNFFGTLHRRDEWGRWEQVGGRVGCATVMPGLPLGTTPLESADDPAFTVSDVIDLSLELTGAEILAAQALASTDLDGVSDEAR